MWDELGIPATKDLKEIRRAYAARLRAVGKSEDREAFQRLRSAYERALAHAESNGGAKPTITELTRSSPQEISTKEPIRPAQADLPADVLAEIQSAVTAGNTQLAIALYERGLAQGTLPIGMHRNLLDHIMSGPVRDASLDLDSLAALLGRVGWSDTPFGQPLSSVHAAAISRLEAERWLKALIVTERGEGSVWFLLRTSPRWIRALTQRRWERRNARLLLVDRPQLPRLLKRSAIDLGSRVAEFHYYERWLKGRVAQQCAERADRLLAFDKRWGTLLRRGVFFAIIATPLGILAFSQTEFGNAFGVLLIVFLAGALLRAIVRFAKSAYGWVKELASR